MTSSPGHGLARMLFRTSVLFYVLVVLVAGRNLPVGVPAQVAQAGQADAWTSRADLVSLLVGAGLGTALFISVVGALLRGCPPSWVGVPGDVDPARLSEVRRRARSSVVSDVYLIGVVAMLLLTSMNVAVVRQVTSPDRSTGPWGPVLLVLFVAGLLGLAVSRRHTRRRQVDAGTAR